MSIRIVFMGSPEFALPSLQRLAAAYEVCGVVTQPDRASGRGRELKPPPVKVLAQELGIPVIQPEKLRLPEPMDQLRAWHPDLIVVAAYGQILKQDVLDLPRYGCINVHASLLPRWRGAAPVNAAILAGDVETGVTIMKMDAGLDTGPMYAKRSIPVGAGDTTGSMLDALSHLGADLLHDVLPDILAGNLKPQLQSEAGMTYAPMLKKEDGLLDFDHAADELERRVRAMSPWPGAWFLWGGAPLKVTRASVKMEGLSVPAGQRFILDGRPAVTCSRGSLILEEVQPSGKKVMPGKAFLAGAREWVSLS